MKVIPPIGCGIILAFVGLSDTAQSAPHETATACEGNACSDVRIWYDGCYHAINHGKKQVVLVLGEWQMVLSPGQPFTLKDLPNHKSCPRTFSGIAKANY
jgi:hypothetical protein